MFGRVERVVRRARERAGEGEGRKDREGGGLREA